MNLIDFEPLTKIISLKVLIAMDDVMGWFEEVLMEIKDMRLHYDISESTVKLNLEKLTITTTRRTTDLQYVSIKLHQFLFMLVSSVINWFMLTNVLFK